MEDELSAFRGFEFVDLSPEASLDKVMPIIVALSACFNMNDFSDIELSSWKNVALAVALWLQVRFDYDDSDEDATYLALMLRAVSAVAYAIGYEKGIKDQND